MGMTTCVPMKIPAILALALLVGLCGSLSAADATFSKSTFLSRVTIDVSRIKSSKVEGGDFDDMRDRIAFRLKLRNSDPNKGFDGLKYEMFIFGQSMVNRKAYKLLQKSTGTFSLSPLQTYETETPEIVTEWDDTNAVFGEKYKGWYLKIFGPDGSLVVEKSVSSFFGNTSTLSSLKEGGYYDKDLKKIDSPGY